MRYKLVPGIADQVPFDPRRLTRGETAVIYDQVEVEDVTARQGADVTFFCLDVEDTHNFVTAGGVVHNCRPPGNRDPQPNEIESCRRYLESQVELIEPDLICTLGNFATKLLRADATGISRLHGQVQELMLGPRAVRLYPLYHPAAALYTPSTLEALRADFHRLPALLALGPLPQPETGEVPDAHELAEPISEPAEAAGEPQKRRQSHRPAGRTPSRRRGSSGCSECGQTGAGSRLTVGAGGGWGPPVAGGGLPPRSARVKASTAPTAWMPSTTVANPAGLARRVEQQDRLGHRDRADRDQEPGAPQRQHVLDREIGRGEHREGGPERKQRCRGGRPFGPEGELEQQVRATAKISRHGIAQTRMIPSARSRTGRVSSPAARRRETSGTR